MLLKGLLWGLALHALGECGKLAVVLAQVVDKCLRVAADHTFDRPKPVSQELRPLLRSGLLLRYELLLRYLRLLLLELVQKSH